MSVSDGRVLSEHQYRSVMYVHCLLLLFDVAHITVTVTLQWVRDSERRKKRISGN